MSKRRHGSYQDPVADVEYEEVDEQQEDTEAEDADVETDDEEDEDFEEEERRPRKRKKAKKEKEGILTPKGKRLVFGGLAILGLAGVGFGSYKYGAKKHHKLGDSEGYSRGYDEGQSEGRRQVYAALEKHEAAQAPEETVEDTVPFEE